MNFETGRKDQAVHCFQTLRSQFVHALTGNDALSQRLCTTTSKMVLEGGAISVDDPTCQFLANWHVRKARPASVRADKPALPQD